MSGRILVKLTGVKKNRLLKKERETKFLRKSLRLTEPSKYFTAFVSWVWPNLEKVWGFCMFFYEGFYLTIIT